jgi:hypothetical protein
MTCVEAGVGVVVYVLATAPPSSTIQAHNEACHSTKETAKKALNQTSA